jgi:hypothetical protein
MIKLVSVPEAIRALRLSEVELEFSGSLRQSKHVDSIHKVAK